MLTTVWAGNIRMVNRCHVGKNKDDPLLDGGAMGVFGASSLAPLKLPQARSCPP